VQHLRVRQRALDPPPLADRDALLGQAVDVLGEQVGDDVEEHGLGRLEGRLGKLDAGLEQQLHQGLRDLGLHWLVVEVEEVEVAPVIEDADLRLVLAGAEKVLPQTGAAADHLPELDLGIDRLGEDQVDHLGDVDAGVQHVYGDRHRELVGGLLPGAGGGFEVRELAFRGGRLGAGLLQLCEQGLELGLLLSKLVQCRLLFLFQLRLSIGASAARCWKAGQADALPPKWAA
jgi:hypothetical protein